MQCEESVEFLVPRRGGSGGLTGEVADRDSTRAAPAEEPRVAGPRGPSWPSRPSRPGAQRAARGRASVGVPQVLRVLVVRVVRGVRGVRVHQVRGRVRLQVLRQARAAAVVRGRGARHAHARHRAHAADADADAAAEDTRALLGRSRTKRRDFSTEALGCILALSANTN